MNKTQEALKLAQDLRALADRFSEGWHDGIKIDASDIVLLSDAAEALAEQPTQLIKQGWDVDDLLDKPKQPAQQEPMALDAIYAAWHGAGVDIAGGNWNRFIEMLPPLYTSPQPSKPWVGLTDEDADELIRKFARYELLRAIEAKLREKNAAPCKPLTDEQLWANDQIMSLNADLGWHMDTIRMFARAIEAAHGIGEQK